MKSKYVKIAWLVDEDVLLKGTVSKKVFVPDNPKCGFSRQKVSARDKGTILFYNLEEAKRKTSIFEVVS